MHFNSILKKLLQIFIICLFFSCRASFGAAAIESQHKERIQEDLITPTNPWSWHKEALWYTYEGYSYRCVNIVEVLQHKAIPKILTLNSPFTIFSDSDYLEKSLNACPYELSQLSLIYELERERKAFFAYLRGRPWGRLADKYIRKFEKQRKKFMQKERITWDHIYAVERKAQKETQKYIEKNQGLVMAEPIKKAIKDIIRECNVNPNYIEVLHSENFRCTAGHATLHLYCPDEGGAISIKFEIFHELVHTLNLDWLIHGTKKISRAHAKQREKEADILSGLTSLNVAQEGIAWCADFLDPEIFPRTPKGPRHPSFSKRHAYLVKLYKQMLAALKQDALKKADESRKGPFCMLKPVERAERTHPL